MITLLKTLKSEGIDVSLPSVLKRDDVDERIQSFIVEKQVPWSVKQCRDKFKNLLKNYRKQMRLRRLHTGNGEAPAVDWERGTNQLVAASDPAINRPIMLDGQLPVNKNSD